MDLKVQKIFILLAIAFFTAQVFAQDLICYSVLTDQTVVKLQLKPIHGLNGSNNLMSMWVDGELSQESASEYSFDLIEKGDQLVMWMGSKSQLTALKSQISNNEFVARLKTDSFSVPSRCFKE